MLFVAVGDAAFPLLEHLMRPYPGKQANIDRKKRVYNYWLSRARRVVESAFGILAARWKVFRKAFEIPMEKVDKVVIATCILHNYLMVHRSGNGDYFDEAIDREVHVSVISKHLTFQPKENALLLETKSNLLVLNSKSATGCDAKLS
ncbi:hypothetical protein J437_LFUL007103 [Ladona fulva]|uniref:DDE Tnp4 domain-containing protein n=1 Tax=Ladona fulva TaxID=123851 RepID=A0A8K0K204_LADFU|nr:hypothetical protein J437_LFUL007103 [Ladona fulva]